jgi:hypothetical protein
MGHYGVELVGVQNGEQAPGNEDVTEPGQNSENPRCEHFASEKWPQFEIGDPESVSGAKGFELVAERTGLNGFASPEGDDERGGKQDKANEEGIRKEDLPRFRMEKRLGLRDVHKVGNEGDDQPGDQNRDAEGEVSLEVGNLRDV